MNQTLDKEKFVKAIKTKRLVEMDVTIRDAAKKAKVSFSTLSRMENYGTPELTNFIKVCNWLNAPVSDFITVRK